MAMHPMDACRELKVTLAELIEYVNAAEDLYPNPRYRLYRPAPLGQKSQPLLREPCTTRPAPSFSVDEAGAANGIKIGQNVDDSEVSATRTSPPSLPFRISLQHQHHHPTATSPLYPIARDHGHCLNSWLLHFIFPAIYHSFGKSVSSLASTTPLSSSQHNTANFSSNLQDT